MLLLLHLVKVDLILKPVALMSLLLHPSLLAGSLVIVAGHFVRFLVKCV